MNRGRVLSVLALVLAVAALGTIAGGLSADEASGGERSPGVGFGSGEGSGIGEGEGTGINVSGVAGPAIPTWVVTGAILATVWLSLLVAGAYVVGFLWQASLRDLLTAIRWVLTRVVAIVLVVGVLVAFLFLIAGLFADGGGGLGGATEDAGIQLPGDSRSVSPTTVTGLTLLVGVVGAVLVVIVFTSRRGDGEKGPVTVGKRPTGGNHEPRSTALDTPGDLVDPDATNDVYRAWIDLREEVGGRGRAESPADLRRRALDAGFDERAVSELTALFNAVRYGDDGATTERERRARELGARLAREGAADPEETTNR